MVIWLLEDAESTKVADQKLPTFAGSECIGVFRRPLGKKIPVDAEPGHQVAFATFCLKMRADLHHPDGTPTGTGWFNCAKMISVSAVRRQQYSVRLHGWRTAVDRPDAGCISTQGIRGIIPQCSADVQIVGCNLHDLFVLACDYSPSQCQMMPNVF